MPPTVKGRVRSALYWIRTARRWSLGALATATGVSRQTLRRLEAGDASGAELRVCVRIATVLGLSVEEVFPEVINRFGLAASEPPPPAPVVIPAPSVAGMR